MRLAGGGRALLLGVLLLAGCISQTPAPASAEDPVAAPGAAAPPIAEDAPVPAPASVPEPAPEAAGTTEPEVSGDDGDMLVGLVRARNGTFVANATIMWAADGPDAEGWQAFRTALGNQTGLNA